MRATRACRRGFSLIEIVFVIGLMTILAGIVATISMDSLFGAGDTKSAVEIFREATHEARLQAINESQVVYLTFNQDAQEFRLSTKSSAPVTEEDEPDFGSQYGFDDEWEDDSPPAPADTAQTVFPVFEDELEVAFYGIPADAGGPAAFDRELTTEPIGRVVYHPSGVSSPAIARFSYSNGDELDLTLDPFSNGPKLSREERVGY